MQEINCDECEKKDCPQRLKGAVCALNKDTKNLSVIFESRDPVVIARKFINVLDSEITRYEKAKDVEDIGGKQMVTYTDKDGNVVTKSVAKGIDSRVSGLAFNILKGGKLISDIINPPKPSPFLQQNNQYNFNVNTVDEIMGLPEEQQKNIIRFIDDKLDAARKNEELPQSSNA